jgi:hypothetical protein
MAKLKGGTRIYGAVKIDGGIYDSSNQIGIGGSILVSTGVGISWTEPYAAGLQGNQGVQGLQGNQGVQGLQGNQGVQGLQGRQGTQGLQGNQGVQGLQGNQGVQGLQGNQGVQGLQGNQGVQGLQGNQGVQGNQGNQGVQGLQGNQGNQGVQGLQGNQGNQGVQGLQGLQGNQGVQGLQGNQGVQGLQGNQGVQGLQGNQGVQGLQGNQGVQGLQGNQGNQGVQGVQGLQGQIGPVAGSNSQIIFNQNNVSAGATDFVYIASTENVGIGSTLPQAKLTVGGDVSISGVVTASRFDGNLNALGKTYYVSTNGSDSNSGTNINEPFGSLSYALSVSSTGDIISLESGTYTEIFPLTVPQGVTIRGAGIRATFIQPTNGTKQNDCFLLNGETSVEDLTIGNFFEPGVGFKFANNAKTTTRSPYIQRVTVLNKGSVTSATDLYGFDTAHAPPTSYKAGRGALIDGSVVQPTTLEPAMLFNECTFICPDNIALEMTNGARTEWVNCFTYFADTAIYAHDGTVGLASTGYVRVKTSGLTGSTPGASDEIYYLEANSQSGTYDQVGTALTITRVGHGLTVGDRVFADFTSGTASDGFYRVTEYVGINTFVITMGGSVTTSGNVSYKEALGFGTVRSYDTTSGLSSITAKGEGLFELPSSRLGKTVTAYGNAQLTTSPKKFGTASLSLDGTGDYIRCEGGSDFLFAGDFTSELWIYPTTVTGTQYLFTLGTETTGRYNLYLVSGVVTGNFYGGSSTTFGGSIVANNWTKIALVRSGSTITAYVNGTALGTTETNSSTIGNTGQLTIGADTSGASTFNGYIDEFRLSSNARYTGNFTPETSQFDSDGFDKILLHFNGVTGSASFVDSTIPRQDVRWVRSGVGIATATKITLADYQQFGAEMRSIGSAAVFGDTGVIADGPGSTLRLFAFNFGHIGSGKDFSQDISLVNQEREAIELNNGRVYYVSVDQAGDFRVGNAFYVNQDDGIVNLGGQEFTINSLSDLNITDGANTTTLTPTSITVGNLQLSGNQLTSTSGDITINPSGSSETTVQGNLNVTGIVTASVIEVSALQVGDTSIAIDDTGSNGTIRLNTDGVEAFRVNNAQNVGIGTNDPKVKLDVQGNVRISGVSTFKDKVIFDSTNSIQIPVGNTSQRDAVGVAVTGQIRYNSEYSTFEGFGPGGQWGSLGGVKDVDGNTYIIPETAPGANENTLYFYADGFEAATLSKNQLDLNVDTVIDYDLKVSGISTFVGGIELDSTLKDVYNNVGVAGSILVSTGAGVSWTPPYEAGLQGAQGLQGVQGLQGLQGNQGVQGLQGNQGNQGVQGLQGNQGRQGVQGLQGNQGNQGVQGLQGNQGLQGLQGNQGLQGLQGNQGLQGLQGNQGLQGLQGNQGLQGLQGNQGVQGLQGNQGVQGLQGNQGVQGLQGNQGVQGLQGNQGNQGLQGNQGVQGLQGNQGNQGVQGLQGNQGNQGVQGLQGRQGTQGLQGNQGTQGLQGNQGTQGLQGNQGTQGLQGNQGVQGLQGNQGNQGVQGLQGNQGNQGLQGLQGNQGVQGLQGNQGNQGVQGLQGNQGNQGVQGLQGNQGNQGVQGLQGNQGVQGLQGNQGVQGLQGNQGTQGLQGNQGNQGVQGLQGNQGNQGVQGLQGNQGNQGVQGLQGNQGVQGLQGNQGNQGVQGLQGNQGNQGVQGLQGNQGNQGVQGLQGNQGNQGVQGLQGNQGNQGVQGLQSTQGNQGVQGLQGNQGVQGLQGRQGTQGLQGNQGVQGLQGLQGNNNGGFTVSNDVSTNALRYIGFTTATSGISTIVGISSTKLVFNPSTGNLGIGTTNPAATLQVKDALAFETTNTTTTSTSQIAIDTFATSTFRSAKYHAQITCPGQLATLGGITTGGRGYTAGTFNITFTTSSGTGSAAQGTLTISNGTVGQLSIISGGANYTTGDVLTASGGSGLQVSVGTTDGTGAILTLGSITSAGIGYTAGVGVGTTSLTFLGGTGTSATGLATIFDGVITSSTLLQQPTTGTGGTVYYSGSNYSTASVLSINRSDLANTITTITTSGISTFTSLTTHGLFVNDIIRTTGTSNGLTAGVDYYVVATPTTTTFTLGTSLGVEAAFTAGTSLAIGFYRNSANAGGQVAYTNAIAGVSTNYQVSDLLVLQNGTSADYIEYAGIANNDILGIFAADISGSNARLLITPTYPNNTIRVARQVMLV